MATPVMPRPQSSTSSSSGHAAAMRASFSSVMPEPKVRRKVRRESLPRSSRTMMFDASVSQWPRSSLVSLAPMDCVIMSNRRDERSGTQFICRDVRWVKASKGFGCGSTTVGEDELDREYEMLPQPRASSELGSFRSCSRLTSRRVRCRRQRATDKSASKAENIQPVQDSSVRFGKLWRRPRS